ncbi:MAG: HlyD family efflux transporter periplasmic adaptor subunit [Phycisphaerales bacterium]|nr:HlyD family efflux transporter periplasmic adaptor subunit [Phycisphaerales bacterium]
MKSRRRLLILPPVFLGGVVFAWLVFKSEPPERVLPREHARTLRVISAPEVDVIPRAIGYGISQPARVWRAVAEVKGRIVEVHSELEPGSFLKKGERAARIDPEEYDLILSQLRAEIGELEAQLAELAAKEVNDRASLKIEEASLELAQRDLERLQRLIKDASASPTEVREEERTMLAQKQKVQNLRNSLNLFPAQQDALQASLSLRKARLDEAKLDLERTKIVAPFGCRLREVSLEVGEYVATGEVLFEADGTDATEVEVQVPVDQARLLIRSESDAPLGVVPDSATIRKFVDTKAFVRLNTGNYTVEWEARFERIRERLDPDTRTVGLVVAVDSPYEKAIPSKRPPLFRDVFCEVEFRGKPQKGRIVVPRAAVHDGHVYVLDAQNRLRRRMIGVQFEQTNFVCVAEGLRVEETVVVSDPTPAVVGMLVDPVSDEVLRASLIAEATAQTHVR